MSSAPQDPPPIVPVLAGLTLEQIPAELLQRAVSEPFDYVRPPALERDGALGAELAPQGRSAPTFRVRLALDPRRPGALAIQCTCGWWNNCPHGWAVLADLTLCPAMRDAIAAGTSARPHLAELSQLRERARNGVLARRIAEFWLPAGETAQLPSPTYELEVLHETFGDAGLASLELSSVPGLRIKLKVPGQRAALDPATLRGAILQPDDEKIVSLLQPDFGGGRRSKNLVARGPIASVVLELLRTRDVRTPGSAAPLSFEPALVRPRIARAMLPRSKVGLSARTLGATSPAMYTGPSASLFHAPSPENDEPIAALQTRWRSVDGALDVPAEECVYFAGPHPFLFVAARNAFFPVDPAVDSLTAARLQHTPSAELLRGYEAEIYEAARRGLRGRRIAIDPPEALGLPARAAPELVARIDGSPLEVSIRLEAQYRHKTVALSPAMRAKLPDESFRDVDTELAGLARLEAAGLVWSPTREAFYAEDEAAARFWGEIAPALRGPGEPPVALLVPDKLARVTVRRPLRMRVRVALVGNWLETDVKFDADEVEATMASMKQCLTAKRRWVVLRDGSIARLSEQAADAAGEVLDVLPRGAGPLAPFQLGRIEHWLDTGATGEMDPALRSLRDRLRTLEVTEPRLPAGLHGALRPYQRQGLAWLQLLAELGAGGILADDMGLGKTITALAAILERKEREGPALSLVVCPTSVAGNWEREAARFTPGLRVVRLRGVPRPSAWEGADLVVTTYGMLRRHIEALGAHEFRYAVLDEAQNVKNPDADTSRAARRLRARDRLALTGTPIENRLMELWSIMEYCNPGLLGPRAGFEARYERAINTDAEGASARRLRAVLRPFVLRRTKGEVLSDLPPREEIERGCELGARQRALYNGAAGVLREQVARNIARDGLSGASFTVLTALLRLRQLALDPRLVDATESAAHSAKRDAFLELVRELRDEGRRALVFSQFVELLSLWRRDLEREGIAYEYLDGSTVKRDEVVARFQTGAATLFLISLKAGGTGLNLTAADTVILCDPWWNPAVEDQASDRAHRIGQTRRVTVYRLVARGTVEDKIMLLKSRKRALADAVVRAGGAALRGLSEDDLRLLLGGVEADLEADADGEDVSEADAASALARGRRFGDVAPTDAVDAQSATDFDAAEVERIRAAAVQWLTRPGATRRALAAEALVRFRAVTALLAGRGATLDDESLGRLRATTRPPARPAKPSAR